MNSNSGILNIPPSVITPILTLDAFNCISELDDLTKMNLDFRSVVFSNASRYFKAGTMLINIRYSRSISS